MILRLCRVQVRPGKEREFEDFTRRHAVPFMKNQKGLRDFWFGWAQEAGVLNVASCWDSFEDVERFAGPDPQKAVVLPDEAHMVAKMEIQHFGPQREPR